MPKKTIALTCKICGKGFEKALSVYNQDLKKCSSGKFCSRECFYKSPERSPNKGRFGEKSLGWKGGRLYERGYKLVICDQEHPFGVPKGAGKKYIREHRLILEKHLGRYLNPDEVVHHIDGDISNNTLSNLCLMSNSAHSKLHKTGANNG
jgi:hypothetical protein